MCFTSKDHSSYIAKKDILCYKSGHKLSDGKFKSLHFPYIYSKRVVEPLVEVYPIYYNTGSIFIERGYHSFMGNDEAIFIIPKGTKYYMDSATREYVSERIMFFGWNTWATRLKLKLWLKKRNKSTN